MSASVLGHPHPSQTFILTTDASTVAILVELVQSTPDGVRPVAHFSRVLTKTERKYSTYDCELHRPLQFRSVVKDP